MPWTRLAIVLLPIVVAGCGSSSPTSPDPGPTLPTQPYSLTVRTSTAPPADRAIPGVWFPYVYVGVIDTPSSTWRWELLQQGRTSVTFDNVTGLARVRVGDVPAGTAQTIAIVETSVTMDGAKEIDVLLKPRQEQRTLTLVPTSTGARPATWSTSGRCAAYHLPIYHDGPVSATVNWNASQSDLTMELWREDDERLAVSTSDGTGKQVIPATNVTGGATYYLRILYDYAPLTFSGTISATS